MVLVSLLFTNLGTAYFSCWIIGAIAFVRKPKTFSHLFFWAGLLLVSCGIGGIEFEQKTRSISLGGLHSLIPTMDVSRILLAAGFSLFIQQMILVVPKSWIAKKLDKAGGHLAAFSYTLYLTHYPILKLMAYWGIKRATTISIFSFGTYIFMISICILMSWIIYFFFEKRTATVRKYIRDLFTTHIKKPLPSN